MTATVQKTKTTTEFVCLNIWSSFSNKTQNGLALSVVEEIKIN